MGVYYNFGGQRIIRPGGYTKRSFPVVQGKGNIGGKVLILGEALTGGVPFNAYPDVESVINVVTSQDNALKAFGGGNIYYASEFFLTPTGDSRFNTPSQAECIVVNTMTQATVALNNSVTAIIDILFNKFGTDGNQAAVKISAGTVAGKLIQLMYKGQEVLNKDNVKLSLFDIQYTGSGSASSMTITATGLNTTCTGALGDNLTILFAEYASLGDLVSKINSTGVYTCTLTGKSDELANVFDIVTAQDIKTSVYSCMGTVEALIREINSTGTFTATLKSGSTRLVPDNLTVFKFFASGTVTSATTQNWTDALIKLEKYDVDCLVIASGSTVIKALVNAHCERMNGLQIKRYRQWGSGASITQNTKALRIAEMKSYNSAYTEYCVSPFKRYDFVNKCVPATDFEPFMLYAMIAGLRYSNNIGMDVVFKYLNVLSTPDIDITDQNDYAEAGGTLIQKTNNVLDGSKNFQILVNNTTYQGSQVTRTNPSVVYEINCLTKHFEEWIIEQLRGLDSASNSVIIASIQNKIITDLFPIKYRDSFKWISDSIDENGKITPAFSNVSFYQDGEQFFTSATLTMSLTPRFAFNFLTFVTPGQYV